MKSGDTNDDVARVEVDGETNTIEELARLKAPNLIVQRLLQGIAAAIILALAVFITVSVIMRYTGNGILGAVEIAALSMVLLTVLVVPAATVADENFRVELADFS